MAYSSDRLARRLRETVARHGVRRIGRTHSLVRPTVEVDLLSGSVLRRGVPVDLPPAVLAVVVALAIHDHPVPRDVLVDALYPDADPAKGRTAVKVNVHRAKRRIGVPDVIRYEAGRYALEWCVNVDVHRIESMVRGLRRNHSLAPDARASLLSLRTRMRAGRPACMLEWPWFEDMERTLRDLDYEAAVLLAGDALIRGRFREVSDITAELLRADPLDEVAAEIAIRASVQCGDTLGAAIQYRRYAATLRRELSEKPPETLRKLIDQPAAG